MKHLHPNYYDMDNWIILETKVCRAFDINETPFTAYKVKIGTLDIEDLGFNNRYSKSTYDIIRWISQRDFNYLMKNRGAIIW